MTPRGGLVDAGDAAAAHDALIKHAGGLIVVLLEDLIGYLVLAELLVVKSAYATDTEVAIVVRME